MERRFNDAYFLDRLKVSLNGGRVIHQILAHVEPLQSCAVPDSAERLGRSVAGDLGKEKAILGIFDEGCIGIADLIWRNAGALCAV